MTPDLLSRTGEALYGSQWQTRLADDLGFRDPSRIREMLTGRRPIPPGVAGDLLRKVDARAEAMAAVRPMLLVTTKGAAAAAYQAAWEASCLRKDPLCATSIGILVREGEKRLADRATQVYRDWASAGATVDFLVNQRPIPDGEGSDFFKTAPVDPTLETLINRAREERSRAHFRWGAVETDLHAVADRIVQRTPGAATADLSVA